MKIYYQTAYPSVDVIKGIVIKKEEASTVRFAKKDLTVEEFVYEYGDSFMKEALKSCRLFINNILANKDYIVEDGDMFVIVRDWEEVITKL